ncbi:MAG: hypothetical protein HY455_03490 [Parcubacteria group bacterium]|nr:hypothetical protein [Parcubacteria group bacterium]
MFRRFLNLFFWEVFDEKIPDAKEIARYIQRRSLTLNHAERAEWQKAVQGYHLRTFIFAVCGFGSGMYLAFCLANGYLTLLLGYPLLPWALRGIMALLLVIGMSGLVRQQLLNLSRAAGMTIQRFDSDKKDNWEKPA